MYRGVRGRREDPPAQAASPAAAVAEPAAAPQQSKVDAPSRRPTSDRPTRKAVGAEVSDTPEWILDLRDWQGWGRIFTAFICLVLIWVAAKILYVDSSFTLIAFDNLGWVPDTWNEGGYALITIGTITGWYVLALVISVIQWSWFPWYIRPRVKSVDREKNDNGPWHTRISLRKDLQSWQIAVWAIASFINVGTSFTGLGLYIQGGEAVNGIGGLLPFWGATKLPTSGWAYNAITFVGSVFTSQGPEILGKRAIIELLSATLGWSRK